MLYTQLARVWWLVALRGVVAIAFGAALLTQAAWTVDALSTRFAAYAVIAGFLNLFISIGLRPSYERWRAVQLHGATDIVAAALALFWPGLTNHGLLHIILLWALAGGALEIGSTVTEEHEIEDSWLWALAGSALTLLGLILLFTRGAGALARVDHIGLLTLVHGLPLLALGLRQRDAADLRRQSA